MSGKFISLTIVLVLLLSLSPSNQTEAADNPPVMEEYVFLNSWGGESNVLNEPTDIAIGPDGRIYIANRGMSRIAIITPGDDVFNNIGSFGDGEGQMMGPSAIAIDDSGYLYVADSGTVSKFTLNGEFIKRWGYFDQAEGVAVDSEGYVYVTDSGNHQIKKFTSEGVGVTSWGGEGQGEGEFNYPQGIAIDPDNNVYVADTQNHRIQKFASNGKYLTQWGVNGSEDGEFIWPLNVEIGNHGEIFVSDWGNQRVQVFDSDLNFITKWGIYGTEELHFRSPRGMAIDSEDNIIVAVAGVNMVHKYTPSYDFVTFWGITPATPGKFYWPWDIAVDNSGNLFVADTANRRIQKFNPYGVLLTQWDIKFEGIDWAWPIKIELDVSGNVYVLDPGYAQIQKFDPNGNRDTSWQLQDGIIAVNQDYPEGMAIFEDQFLYVTGGNRNFVHQFNLEDGSFIQSWGGDGSSAGKFNYPLNVAVDKDGYVYVVDAMNYRIQKFDWNGNFVKTWGILDNGAAIFVDSNSYVFVLYSSHRSIQAYTADGTYIGQWQAIAMAKDEQLASPRGLSMDNDRNIYIADTFNNRIVVLAPELPAPDPETGLIINGNFDGDNRFVSNIPEQLSGFNLLPDTNERAVNGLAHWTYGGKLPVSRTIVTYEGDYSVRLGKPTTAVPQEIGSTWMSQVFFVPKFSNPVLKFNYNIFTNDIMNNADFIVEIQDGVGLNNKTVVLRDGYQESKLKGSITATKQLGWKSKTFSLSKYEGQFIRLVISIRNLNPESKGIWAYVENISVLANAKLFFPIILR